MAKSVNKVTLLGSLGKDLEVRYTPSGVAVASGSLATSESVKKADGTREDKTEWHNIVIWDKQAEYAAEHLKKGSRVYLEGKLQTRKWQDRDGKDRYTTEIVVREIVNLSPSTRQGGNGGQAPAQDTGNGYDEPVFNPDDDIPF